MEGAFLAVALNSGEVRLYKMPAIINPLPGEQTAQAAEAVPVAPAKDAKGATVVKQATMVVKDLNVPEPVVTAEIRTDLDFFKFSEIIPAESLIVSIPAR